MNLDTVATLIFIVALIHTFSCSLLHRLGNRFPSGSVLENLFHLLGEIEIVFGLWSALLIIIYAIQKGSDFAFQFTDSLNFQEPLFVFVIMAMASTKPIIEFTEKAILLMGDLFSEKIRGYMSYFLVLTIGPLLGSLITEPAAMTVTAMLLSKRFIHSNSTARFKYMTLAVLFVNVSIGGTLTHFAAPPVVMVARIFQWDTAFMFLHFGYRAIAAVCINSFIATIFALIWKSKVVSNVTFQINIPGTRASLPPPFWVSLIHILFLVFVILLSHHTVIFVGVFLFFIGFVHVTREYQSPLQLRSSLLVGFFLAGLVVLGQPQSWWLTGVIQSLNDFSLYVGATLLTAITDNAALTYLGSKVPNLSESARYFLVAGAVTGGGLTVIANAPNPIGFSILKHHFEEKGIESLKLFLFAVPPTLVAALFFCLF